MAVVAEPSERRAATNSQDAAVRLERVSKSFGGRKVLDSVSFEVANGSGFAILGRSGTGKSVMLRHIVGLMTPDAGRVYVYDDEVSALKGKELSRVRRGIGFLFQNAALFDSITVGENVAFPLRRHTKLRDEEIRDKALEKLRSVAARFEDEQQPYLPLVLSMWKNRYGTYDHLSRVKEWSVGGTDEEDGMGAGE